MTTASADDQPRPSSVPQLIRTEDNAFWFDAARQGRLLIQRCSQCSTLRQPPGPCCPECRSFDWDSIESAGRGRLHSFTVVHHPPDSSLTYPLAIGLVDLAEGTRLLADIADVEREDLCIGMELEVTFTEHAHGEILPQFRRPADPEDGA